MCHSAGRRAVRAARLAAAVCCHVVVGGGSSLGREVFPSLGSLRGISSPFFLLFKKKKTKRGENPQ